MIKKTAYSLNQLISEIIIEELLRFGIDTFFVSPGSRSTPLTAAATKGNVITAIDERGSAFAALGFARARVKPAVLICTSGTAAANYYPAVIEAYNDEVPLIIITADRPDELHNVKANQTIEQKGLYGHHARYETNLKPPTDSISPEIYLTEVNRAVKKSQEYPQGPVHINIMFREPLAPIGDVSDYSFYLNSICEWVEDDFTFLNNNINMKNIPRESVKEISGSINHNKKGIIICGDLKQDVDLSLICELSERTNWPIFADIRSNLRTGLKSTIISYFDQILLSDNLPALYDHVIVHLGGGITSSRIVQYIEANKPQKYISIASSDIAFNAHHGLTKHYFGDVSSALKRIIEKVKVKQDNKQQLIFWRDANKVVKEYLENYFESQTNLSEPWIANIISKEIQKDSALFLGSSMPIRDYDMYSSSGSKKYEIAANRGASGIDGSIASFFGFSKGHKKNGTAIIGDIAFIHDMNSLALFKQATNAQTLVVINNNGGGIFSFLPIVECEDIFEPLFGMPHGLSFEKLAEMFSMKYYNPLNKSDFIKYYRKSQSIDCKSIIEIKTDRSDNLKEHQNIQSKIKNLLDSFQGYM